MRIAYRISLMPYKNIEAKRAWARRYAREWRAKNLQRALARERVYSAKRQREYPEQVRRWRRESYARHKIEIHARRKGYFDARKDKKAAYDREYRKRNLAKIIERVKEWVSANRDHYNAHLRNKRKINPQFAIANNMRGRINTALRTVGLRRNKPLEKMIGCSVVQLMSHLERLFLPGMTWQNRRQWHVDHITPCAAFDLQDETQRARCFHFTNLQPLWARDNLRKGAR